ncbi:MAG TPA: ABC transporter ATP-binding protein, partial [Planctomycetota bacterium]|nr:ABC transporter ATP-binding protein [Planctomycetota bacterium]
LVGANGAGKTTTLLAISGIVRARAGRVVWEGREIQNRPPHEIVRLGIAHAPEGRRIFPRLTVRENLEMGAYGRRDRAGVRADLERVYGLFPVLGERRAQPGGTLSGGEQQMLAVGRALMARPRLLLLDEPSLGLAPQVARRIFEVLGELHRSGTSILLVEQNVRAALGLAARGYVLEGGRVVLGGAARELLADPRVRAAYLGE